MSVDCFDADALIYAADGASALGRRVRALLADPDTQAIGSVMLLPEVLAKPLRQGNRTEQVDLAAILRAMRLYEVDRALAETATDLAARYKLRAVGAVHLATGVVVGADRFVTNNSKDFGKDIAEVEVVYPAELSG